MKKKINVLLCFFSYIPGMYLLLLGLIILLLVLISLMDAIFGTSISKHAEIYLEVVFYIYLFTFLASVLLWMYYLIILSKQTNTPIEKVKLWRRYLLIWSIFANAAFFEKFIKKNEAAAGAKLERFKKFLKLDFFLYLKPPD